MPDAARAVVLTRAHADNAALAMELARGGTRVIELPCVRTEPLADDRQLRAAVHALAADDLVVITSRAGAEAVAGAASPERLRCPVAAVGRATAARARSLGMDVAFVASRADGSTLAAELPLPGGEVVLARSDRADGGLPRTLRSRGARVREVAAYHTAPRASGDTRLARAAILDGATVVVASPSAVDALCEAIGAATLRAARFVAIGPRTAAHVAERLGVGAAAADAPEVRSVLAAVGRSKEVPA